MTGTPGLRWTGPDAIRSAVCAAPALPLVFVDGPRSALTWAVGCLPLAIVGMPAERRERARLIVISALLGASIVLGSLLTQHDVTAVLGIFAVAFGLAVLAARATPVSGLALSMCLPVTAVGLSYDDIGTAAGMAIVFVACAAFSALVLQLWPPGTPTPRPPAARLSPEAARRYGVLIGLAGATSTLLGIVGGTDHVGWAPAAGYFVVRPVPDLQRSRSVARTLSVIVGAGTAVVFLRADPSDVLIALFGIAVIAGSAGTRTSRWYVTPAFGSAIVLTLLLFDDPTTANERWRFDQRVTATIVGIAVAYLFALVVPAVLERRRRLGSRP